VHPVFHPNLGARLDESCLARNVGECSVAIVAIERILPVVGDKEIIEAIMVVASISASCFIALRRYRIARL
jgi:hypothetical protein